MRQIYNKLIRDKIVEAISKSSPSRYANSGSEYKIEILGEKQYLEALKNKLVEEAQEVVKAETTEEIIEELADIQEIIDTITSLLNISQSEILKKQQQKKADKGGFAKKIFLHWVEK